MKALLIASITALMMTVTSCASTGNTESDNENDANGTAGPVILDIEVNDNGISNDASGG